MSGGLGTKARWTLAGLGLTALTGCGAPGESASVGNMLLYAGTTPPPVQKTVTEDVYCPPVNIFEGGAAIQAYSGGQVGDATALRSQVAIGQLARECVGQPDGSTIVKVGVEGRALVGAGGSAGRYNVPVHIVVKSRSNVLANRSRQISVAIPAGDSQASFAVIEDNIVVPAVSANDFEIEVGLGSRAAQGRRRG